VFFSERERERQGGRERERVRSRCRLQVTKFLCTTADGDMQIVRIEESEEWQRDWGRAVVGAALADPTKLSAHRDKMVLFSSLLLLFALRISVIPVAFCVSPWHLDVFVQDCTGGGFRV
jgi:hypothetical protein